MKVYLERKGYFYSPTTVHKYMNTELGLRSIVRPKKPGYEHGKSHKVFENKLKQDFTADEINRKWCTDFTYLFLANHDVRYNCTIITIAASLNDNFPSLIQSYIFCNSESVRTGIIFLI